MRKKRLGRLLCMPEGGERGHTTGRFRGADELKKHTWVKGKYKWSYGCLSTCVVLLGWTKPPPAMYNVRRNISMLTYSYKSLYMKYIEPLETP